MEIVMTIAGTDSGGGAGIQADLKTFQELKVFGTSVVTAVTAQNTQGVASIQAMPPDFVAKQMTTVLSDLRVDVVKTGMLFSPDIIEAVAKTLAENPLPLVIDPVMIAKGGATLLQEEAVTALKDKLLPLATVITPNVPEAEILSGMAIESEVDQLEAAHRLLQSGVQYVIMKGGHMDGDMAVDTVYSVTGERFTVRSPRIATTETHGTGCTFSAALTAFLARGFTMKEAVTEAKRFVHAAISHPLHIGHGHGPTNHFAYNELIARQEVICSEA